MAITTLLFLAGIEIVVLAGAMLTQHYFYLIRFEKGMTKFWKDEKKKETYMMSEAEKTLVCQAMLDANHASEISAEKSGLVFEALKNQQAAVSNLLIKIDNLTFIPENIDLLENSDEFENHLPTMSEKRERNTQEFIYTLELAKEKFTKSPFERNALTGVINRIKQTV